MKKIYKILIKLLISFIILIYIFNKIDFQLILNVLPFIKLWYIPFLFLILIINLFLMTLKWNILLKKYNNIPFKKLIAIYWASDFINLFGLGALGGETYKILSFKNKKEVLFSSLSDRMYSLIWYVSFGLCVFFTFYYIKNIFLALILVVLLYIVLFYIILKLFKIFKQRFLFRLKNTLIRDVLTLTSLSIKNLLLHSIYSIIIIFSLSLLYFLGFKAVGVSANIIGLIIFTPLIIIATVLPISFQGLGIREFLFIQYAKFYSIDIEKALIVSLLIFFVGLIYRLIGSIFFVFTKKTKG